MGGGTGNWPLFVGLAKSRHREDLYKSAFNLKGSNITMRNDLAPFLLRQRKELQKEVVKLKAEPDKYQTKMRDTAFRVWIEYKKDTDKEWKEWKQLDEENRP